MTFFLGHEASAHRGTVRALCVIGDAVVVSGGLDGCTVIWDIADGKLTQRETRIDHEKKSVLSLCVAPGSADFLSGGTDGKICLVESKPRSGVLLRYEGHQGPVCSLSAKNDILMSGSWDGTAKLWNLRSGALLHTLGGHTHAVSVCAVSESLNVTGSQSGILRIWAGSEMRIEVPGAHEDIIRAIVELPHGLLATSSNDGKIKIWEINSDREMTPRQHWKAHDAFIYSLALLSGGILCTCSEDGYAVLWSGDGVRLASIKLPTAVWQCLELPNMDLVTGSEDGFVRIWTKEESRAASLAAREAYAQKLTDLHTKTQAASSTAIDVNNLIPIELADTVRGKQEGATSLFSEGGQAVACEWREGQWVKLGTVISGPGEEKKASSVFYEGDSVFASGMYDFVFEVEVGEGGPMKRLPFSKNQNVLEVAEKFCARENLSKYYSSQITKFIETNAGVQSLPAQTQRATLSAEREPPKRRTCHFPVLVPTTFYHANLKGLHGKLKEENAAFAEGNPLRLAPDEIVMLESIVDKLGTPEWKREPLRKSEVQMVFTKLAQWLDPNCFRSVPVLDLQRLMVAKEEFGSLQRHDGGRNCLLAVIKLMDTMPVTSGCRDGALCCCLRLFANFFALPSAKAVIWRHHTQVFDSIRKVLKDGLKPVAAVAASAVVANFAAGVLETPDATVQSDAIGMACEIIERHSEGEIVLGCLAAIGTVLTHPAERQLKAQWASGLESTVIKGLTHSEAKVRECAEDLEALVNAT